MLDEIIAKKRLEVAQAREEVPVKKLEKSIYFRGPCLSLQKYLTRTEKGGIIAEIKRKSPSKGVINPYISVEQLSVAYMQAGASALSVLTDTPFFGGKNEDLTIARRNNLCPILRKDFTIDEYQVIEAKSIGADAILLIAAVLSPEQIRLLAGLARQLGLETLLEVHSKEEIERSMCDEIDVIGVNNRDLKTFKVSTTTSEGLVQYLPSGKLLISESGLDDVETLVRLRNAGYRGFLVGEALMRSVKPAEQCARLVQGLRNA